VSSLFIHEPSRYAIGEPEILDLDKHDGLSMRDYAAHGPTLAAIPADRIGYGAAPRPVPRLEACSRDRPSPRLSLVLKDLMDTFLGLVLLILAAPVFLAIMAVSGLDGGPIFFSHLRVGVGGRPFHRLKFRTMVVDADRVLEEALAQDPVLAEEWTSSRKLRRDPRVTSVGSFLRKTSLDELPQLFNVLRRDMSLVGPRPIVENESISTERTSPTTTRPVPA